jgi:flagellar biosynthesis protein FlhF
MRVKKFRASSMPEAMALIRAELGPDAVILHSEEIRKRSRLKFLHRPAIEVVAAVDTDLRDFPQPTPATDNAVQEMKRELAALQMTLAKVTETRWDSGPRHIASLDDWYRRLLDEGVARNLAQQIVQTIADELSRWAMDNESVLNEHFHWHLGRLLPPCKPLKLTPGQPLTLCLVGPTGVGKTTSIAKLAANFASQGARVLMITTDTFRVAAIAQIVAFGDILGIPVEVAYTPDQLASLVEGNRQRDLILIDTPGRSQRMPDKIAELGDYVSAVPDRISYLAIAAGARFEDMRQTVDVFGEMSIDGLIFTKTDETASLGPAYTLACESGLSLSYLTNGQRVPEDIGIATAERVIDLLVGPVPDEIRSTRQRW